MEGETGTKSETEGEEKKELSALRKAWNFIWYDDSLLSWILAVAVAFVIVKLIFFPLLSAILGTSLPLVVVESGSMSHPQAGFFGNTFATEKAFDKWWEKQAGWYVSRGFGRESFLNWPFRTGMEAGDIIIVFNAKKVNIGDIIIFSANQKHPIIHRVINVKEEKDKERSYSTKGDNNIEQLESEREIPSRNVLGKAVFRIPKLGWLKLGFVRLWQRI